MFQDRQVNKLYVAVLYGLLPYGEGGVEPAADRGLAEPAQAEGRFRSRPAVADALPRAQPRHREADDTRVALEPVTGRSTNYG